MALADLMALALAGTGAVYGVAILSLVLGLARVRRRGPQDAQAGGQQASVSVIVAARDEAAHLGNCLEALVSQDYPPDHLDIVVVDDRSGDCTLEIARRFGARDGRVRAIQVRESRHVCPKKNALALGISRSRGEIILTTDADCRPGPGWVGGMVRQFGPETGMVAGHSPPDREGGLVEGTLALEALAKAGLSAGGIGIGLPVSCTGRNLGYRRLAYELVGGFDEIGHIVSGDDVLLMRLIASRTVWRIRYATAPETVVPTATGRIRPGSLYHQKVRHAAKAIHYGPAILLPAVAIYLFHLLLLAGIPAMWLSSGVWYVPWIALAGKGAVDLLFLVEARRTVGTPSPLRYFPLLEAVYIPYVVIFSLIGAMNKFQWKTGVKG